MPARRDDDPPHGGPDPDEDPGGDATPGEQAEAPAEATAAHAPDAPDEVDGDTDHVDEDGTDHLAGDAWIRQMVRDFVPRGDWADWLFKAHESGGCLYLELLFWARRHFPSAEDAEQAIGRLMEEMAHNFWSNPDRWFPAPPDPARRYVNEEPLYKQARAYFYRILRRIWGRFLKIRKRLRKENMGVDPWAAFPAVDPEGEPDLRGRIPALDAWLTVIESVRDRLAVPPWLFTWSAADRRAVILYLEMVIAYGEGRLDTAEQTQLVRRKRRQQDTQAGPAPAAADAGPQAEMPTDERELTEDDLARLEAALIEELDVFGGEGEVAPEPEDDDSGETAHDPAAPADEPVPVPAGAGAPGSNTEGPGRDGTPEDDVFVFAVPSAVVKAYREDRGGVESGYAGHNAARNCGDAIHDAFWRAMCDSYLSLLDIPERRDEAWRIISRGSGNPGGSRETVSERGRAAAAVLFRVLRRHHVAMMAKDPSTGRLATPGPARLSDLTAAELALFPEGTRARDVLALARRLLWCAALQAEGGNPAMNPPTAYWREAR